jgi:hypothetical protein
MAGRSGKSLRRRGVALMSLIPPVQITPGRTVGTIVFNPDPIDGSAGDTVTWFNGTELKLYLTLVENGQPRLPPVWTPKGIEPGKTSMEIGLDPNPDDPDQPYTVTYGAVVQRPGDNFQLLGTGTINISPQR